jgi:hypothetical protein
MAELLQGIPNLFLYLLLSAFFSLSSVTCFLISVFCSLSSVLCHLPSACRGGAVRRRRVLCNQSSDNRSQAALALAVLVSPPD